MEQRIVDLESRLLFQEKTIEDLNEVILGQADELKDLRRRLDAMESRSQAQPSDVSEQEARPYGENPGDGEGRSE